MVHADSPQEHFCALALACGGEAAAVLREVLDLRSQVLRSQAPIALALGPTLAQMVAFL